MLMESSVVIIIKATGEIITVNSQYGDSTVRSSHAQSLLTLYTLRLRLLIKRTRLFNQYIIYCCS